MKKSLKRFVAPYADIVMAPFVYPSAWLLKAIRGRGVHRMPLCKRALFQVGVFPIRDYYYEPQFDLRSLKRPLSRERVLPGIDWNIHAQLGILERLTFAEELLGIAMAQTATLDFYLNNGSFEGGDAEYFYQIIRLLKPSRLFEIGSGNSTLMANRAIRRNKHDDPSYRCEHVCIEPYEMPWLEQLEVSVRRQKVEDVGVAFFQELEESDILFIDSSHVVRPEGDVVFEYLELLPSLKKGVIVHVHDIFSPRNYPHAWLVDEVRLWNEQYLLEAFLTNNDHWKVVGALNYLQHNFHEQLRSVCPFLAPTTEPGSFYMQKIG